MNTTPRSGILPVLFFGVLLGALDIAIVGPALPEIRHSFSLDERTIAWVFSSYVLANITGAPLIGKLSDTFGRRSIYILALALFGLGSLLVVISPSYFFLICGRALQGLGAGGIFPVASATIGDTVVPERRGRALGLIGAVFGIAFILGPVVGGLLLPFGWRWLFLINLPLIVILIGLAWRVLPSTTAREGTKLDTPGLLLLSPALLLFALGLTRIDAHNLVDSLVRNLPFWISSLLLFAAFARHEKKTTSPLLNFDAFKNRTLVLAAGFAVGAGLAESTFAFMPRFLVEAFGLSSSHASYLLMVPVAAITVGAPAAGRLLDSIGPKIVLGIGTSLLAAGLFILAFMPLTQSYFVGAAILLGVGISSLVGAPIRYLVLKHGNPEDKAILQSAMSLATNIGQLVGGVFVGAIAASHTIAVEGFQAAFLGIAVAIALLAVSVLGLKKV